MPRRRFQILGRRLRPWFRLPLILAVVTLLSAPGGATPRRKQEPIQHRFLQEFGGAYPENAPNPTAFRSFSIEAAPTEIRLLDGRLLKVWAYNGQVPGPTLRLRLGEQLRVTFTNKLPDETTIHWHGMRVPNAMDGAPGVTQPPIRPGETFVYDFVPKDAGTFWFHPHLRSSEQVERGLYGAVIVEDAKPQPYSQDVLWVLDDWLLGEDGQIFPEFNTRHDLAHDGRWGNVVAVNGRTDAELVVRTGERIRLRLLNAANGRVFAPDFSGLDARVIAVDGMYAAKPLDPKGFELAPGNRLDLDITFGPGQRGQVLRIFDRFTRRSIALGTIRVADESVRTPGFPSPAHAKIPRWPDADRLPADFEYTLDARAGGPFGIQWTLNGEAFPEKHAELALRRWTKLRFTNASARLHPMHIHGQFFRVVSRNGVAVDDPFWRDTVLVHPREIVEIGLVPLDPGMWMLHCHVLEHAEAGMMTMVRVLSSP